jgi:hypothetical protein
MSIFYHLLHYILVWILLNVFVQKCIEYIYNALPFWRAEMKKSRVRIDQNITLSSELVNKYKDL